MHLASPRMMAAQFEPASLAAILFAPAAGSVVGVFVNRLPRGRPVFIARSCCDACGRTLSVSDLVPIVSYLVFRGRCRTCAAPIAFYHFGAEVAATVIAVWAWMVEPDPLVLWANCLLGWMLLALAWIDLVHMRLPDALTLPLLALGLFAEALVPFGQFSAHVLGAIVGYAAFAGIAWVYRMVRGRVGLGGGDTKLLAVAGAWVGWTDLPDVVLLAVLLGIAGTVFSRIRGHAIDAVTALPFGPYLAIALWIVRLYGPLIFGLVDGS